MKRTLSLMLTVLFLFTALPMGAIPVAAATGTTGDYAKTGIILGDVNNDGKVNVRDLGVLIQHLNKWAITIVADAADMTRDGCINMRDLAILQRFLNGWDIEWDPPTANTVDYTVKLVDGTGAAQSGVTVAFYSDANELLAQRTSNADGVTVARLEKGNYIIKVTGTTLRYDQHTAVMTPSKTTLELILAPLYDKTTSTTLTDPLDYEYKKAYYVSEGATYVELVPGTRNYFLFEPTRSGTFRFTTVNSQATVGYYGTPFFIMSTHAGEDIVNNAFTLSVSDVGPSYVLGIDVPANISGTTLTIVRVGEPGWSVADEPWTIYTGSHVPTKFTLPANTRLVDMDITADHQELVYNQQDGYYHLNSANGPVVYLRFNHSPYVNLIDILANQGIRAYLYDTNGSFLRKEEYTSYLSQYYYEPHPSYDSDGTPVNMLDSTKMVYPLNADLIYILQTYTEAKQWDDPNSPNYLFKDSGGNIVPGINNALAWMFALCYAA